MDRVGYCESVRGDDGCQQRGEGGSGGGKCVYPTIKFLSSQIPHVTQMHNTISVRFSYNRGSPMLA